MEVAKLLTVCAPALSLTAGGSPASVKDGGSLTALTVIVNCCAPLVFEFGGVLLPSSLKVTLNVAVPKVSAEAVEGRFPVVGASAGEMVKESQTVEPVCERLKVKVCPVSLG